MGFWGPIPILLLGDTKIAIPHMSVDIHSECDKDL